MKVGIVLGDQKPEVGGGYTFQTDVFENLPHAIERTRHRFVAFCPPAWIERYANDPDFSQIEFAVLRKGSFAERVILSLREIIPWIGKYLSFRSRLESEILKHGVQMAWIVGGYGNPLDIPYVATVWDLMHLTHPWFPEVSSGAEWNRREIAFANLLRRATVIITGTKAGRDEIRMAYGIPHERIRLLPHPTPKFAMDAVEEPISVREKYGISGDFLFYPAQFWPHKNHVVLLGAVELLNRKGRRFTLVLVGTDKGNFGYVRKMASVRGLDDQIRMLGFVPVDDLVALYKQAFALTYASYCGPENLPPLEAFALGCPVIAADIPGSREQLGDAALLVDPTSPKQFADAVMKLDRDEALKSRLIIKGRQRAANWTGKDFVERIVSILDEVAPVRETWGV